MDTCRQDEWLSTVNLALLSVNPKFIKNLDQKISMLILCVTEIFVYAKEFSINMKVKVLVAQFFAALWTVAHQAPLTMEFSRQEYWSGLPCPPSGESSCPRDQTQVSHVVGKFFTIWTAPEV